MIRLEKSMALRKVIRQDDPAELAVSTWTVAYEAIKAGKISKALDFIEYGCTESKAMHDSLVSFVNDAITHLAQFGEEEIEKFLRQKYYEGIKRWLSLIPDVEESLQQFTEFQRGHFSNSTIVEEADR